MSAGRYWKYMVLIKIILPLACAFMAVPSLASGYFGFNIAKDTKADVVKVLKKGGAKLEKEYREEATGFDVIKINGFSRFEKFPGFIEGFTVFRLDGKLQAVSATYKYSHLVNLAFMNNLRKKYKLERESVENGIETFAFKDGDIEIWYITSPNGAEGEEPMIFISFFHYPTYEEIIGKTFVQPLTKALVEMIETAKEAEKEF